MAYWRLHYHAIWACKERAPLIQPEIEPELYKYFFRKARELGGILHAVGGIEDHIHIVFSLAPRYAISDFIGKLKGSSSHWMTHVKGHSEAFYWQGGYGVLSFGDRNLNQVVAYVKNQKEHHQRGKINKIFEKWSEEDDGVAIYWDGTVV